MGAGSTAAWGAVGEDGDRDGQHPVADLFAGEVDLHLARPRHRRDEFGVLSRQVGGPVGARHRAALGVVNGDDRVAVGRSDAIEDLDDRVVAPARAGEQRPHRREGRQHFGVGAPCVEPVRDEPGPVVGDGRDSRLPVGDGVPALVIDVIPERDQHQCGADQEGEDIHPGEAAGDLGPAGRGMAQRLSHRPFVRPGGLAADAHARKSKTIRSSPAIAAGLHARGSAPANLAPSLGGSCWDSDPVIMGSPSGKHIENPIGYTRFMGPGRGLEPGSPERDGE